MQRTLNYFLAALFLIVFFSCEKKLKLKIKDQARSYPVIFAILTNDENERTVTMTSTESFSGKKGNDELDASIKMRSFFDEEVLTKTGATTHKMGSEIYPFTEYNFTCTYNSVAYEYSVFTGDRVNIDSVYFVRQAGGRSLLVADLLLNATDPYAYSYAEALVQVQVGTITASDTTWKKYNERFPGASPKIEFFLPVALLGDSTSRVTQNIISSTMFAKNDLVKIEIYSIDPRSSGYLMSLYSTGNNLLDPLALSPSTTNNYAFTNEGLGVIMPAIKSKKIFRVP